MGEPLGRRVVFNVGGQQFETTVATLQTQAGHLLLNLLDPDGLYKQRDNHEAIFIDRNPALFPYILDYLRKGKVNLKPKQHWLEDLLDEATYYGLSQLATEVSRRLNEITTAVIEAETTTVEPPATSSTSHPASHHIPLVHPPVTEPTHSPMGFSPWKVPIGPGTAACQRRCEAYVSTPTSYRSQTNRPSQQQFCRATRLPSFPLLPSSPSSAYGGTGRRISKEEIDVVRARNDLMNDNPSPPTSFCLPPEYDLGPQVLGTDAEVF